VLLLPALLTLGTLAIARITYPQPQGLAAKPADVETAGLSRSLWIYMGGAMLVAAGFADFSLMAYHFDQAGIVAPALVPVFYAVAMGAGGLGSLLAGRQFDRTGLVLLIPLTIVTAAFAPLAFLGGATAGFIGVVLWGIGMGVHESILAAAVAELVPRVRIASAYGLFTTLYGVAWFIGSAVMGALYDRSPLALVTFSVILELLAVPFFWAVRHAVRPSTVRGEGAA
jgi:predicted MFS family arabinose efflux permease